MIAILGVTALGLLFGDVQWGGVMSTPPSIAPTFLQARLLWTVSKLA